MRTLPLLLVAAPLAVLPATPAAAAQCHIMRIGYAVGAGGVVALEPRNDVIAYGDCVSFTNDTAATATVTVGAHYARQVMPSETTSRATSFVGTTPGRQQVSATSGPSSAPGSTAHGSITVGAAPAASPRPTSSPRPTTASSPAQTSPSPRPAAPPPSTGPSPPGSGPQVAPTPRGRRPTPDRSGNAQQPPVSPAGPIESLPSSPSPPAAVLARGPVEPGSGRGAGLPSALAALAVVGTGAGLARVLLAEPVDSLPTVGGPT